MIMLTEVRTLGEERPDGDLIAIDPATIFAVFRTTLPGEPQRSATQIMCRTGSAEVYAFLVSETVMKVSNEIAEWRNRTFMGSDIVNTLRLVQQFTDSVRQR